MTFSDTTLELTDIQKKRHFFWNRTNKFLGDGSSLRWKSNSKSLDPLTFQCRQSEYRKDADFKLVVVDVGQNITQ